MMTTLELLADQKNNLPPSLTNGSDGDGVSISLYETGPICLQ
jgi:hypothetical protein